MNFYARSTRTSPLPSAPGPLLPAMHCVRRDVDLHLLSYGPLLTHGPAASSGPTHARTPGWPGPHPCCSYARVYAPPPKALRRSCRWMDGWSDGWMATHGCCFCNLPPSTDLATTTQLCFYSLREPDIVINTSELEGGRCVVVVGVCGVSCCAPQAWASDRARGTRFPRPLAGPAAATVGWMERSIALG